MYDAILVPIARKLTGKGRDFSELLRMGIRLFLLILCMSTAALVEIKRLQIARDRGLVEEGVAVPMNIFWQIPQYFLLGVVEIFTFIGQLEFYYNQSPDAMCNALSLLTTALGNYLSTLILTVVTSLTTRRGNPRWIPDNLNIRHLDYFFWLLTFLRFLNMVVYIFCAKNVQIQEANLKQWLWKFRLPLNWKHRSILHQR